MLKLFFEKNHKTYKRTAIKRKIQQDDSTKKASQKSIIT